MYELWRGRGSAGTSGSRPRPFAAIVGGMAVIAVLYFLFAAGILGSLTGGSVLTPDTLSGLVGWPFWKVGALAVLGVLALWTAYGTVALEAENALRKDLHWNQILVFALVALLPLLVVLVGFNDVILAVGFAGAIFAGLQYMTIFALAEKVLQPGRAAVWAMRLAGLVFALAALYEIYVFVVG
jgi:hypothetical protein